MGHYNKISADFSAFEDLIKKFEQIGSREALKPAVERGLRRGKQEVLQKVDKALQPSNLPAHGMYSEGDAKAAVNRDMKVTWEGDTASVGLGFNWDELKPRAVGGVLMFGTPKQGAVKGLKNAIQGKTTEKHITAYIQEEMQEEINRIMNS